MPILVLGLGFTIGAVAVIAAAAPSKGPLPDAAVTKDGEILIEQAPDYISVLDQRGEIAGFVKRDLVLGDGDDEVWPVYAEDLKTLVGHMVAGKGYVALGVDPGTVPDFQSESGAAP